MNTPDFPDTSDLTACSDAVAAFGPASLSNLGPGFDALGLALCDASGGEHLGDRVEAWRVEEPGVHVVPDDDPEAPTLPLDPGKNTAAVAAAYVLNAAGVTAEEPGVALRIRKGIPLGSGIGGSAASAVGGAWATNVLLGPPFEREALVEAVLAGEAVASGSRHGDNVLPALFGDLVLVSPVDPTAYRRAPLPTPLPIALVVPHVPVLTKEARDLLPVQVPRRDATGNAAALAFMLDALRCGDYEAAGRYMMTDRIVEPVRATLVPCYEAVRQAALEAGAFGCALTGSGPALFALAETPAAADDVARAMQTAARSAGIDTDRHAVQAGREGVRTV